MNGRMESEDPDPNLIWIYFFLLPTVLHNALIQDCQSNLHNSVFFLRGCCHSPPTLSLRLAASHVRLLVSHP